ncbi:hypothetical protein [Microbacterium timonense]|uniref:hypothetical protein n=1 Tax=Microbacterium timonense TaxID=2086576 RepID=UPI000D10EAAB|nr:hypothetical protein [Microbacterium timonense]
MNDTTYTGYMLDAHRAEDLARENAMLIAQRERGASLTPPHGRPLTAWLHVGARRGARTAAIASSH